jgi:leucyl aminopeptidase (aminopeptidase T)
VGEHCHDLPCRPLACLPIEPAAPPPRPARAPPADGRARSPARDRGPRRELLELGPGEVAGVPGVYSRPEGAERRIISRLDSPVVRYDSGRRLTAERKGDSVQRLAAIALRRSLGLRRGASLVVETWSTSLPLAEDFWLAARRLGIRPTLLVHPEEAFFASQRVPTADRGNGVGRAERAALESCDGYVHLMGPRDMRRLDALPEASLRAFHRRFRDWAHRPQQRRIPRLLFFAPETALHAGEAPPALAARWRREWIRGSEVPPGRLRTLARHWTGALRSGRRVTISHSNGTHLELGLRGAPPVLQDGAVDAQDLADGWIWTSLPSGVLSVALDGRRGEGVLVANRPSRTRHGAVEGLRWSFERGRLTRFAARRGAAFFEERYRSAGPERERPAILSIGLNPAIRDLPLMEDQELGVVTVYLGHNDDFGGHIRGSFRIHAVLRGADVTIDGRRLLRAGRWAAGRR